MAGIAGQTAGVIGGSDLRKIFGLGRVPFVTTYAEYRRVKLRGLNRGRVVSMIGQRSVASFAIDVGVLAIFFLVKDVGMASLACFMACKVYGQCGDFAYRIPAVVPILSETFWDQETANDQEREEAHGENSSQS